MIPLYLRLPLYLRHLRINVNRKQCLCPDKVNLPQYHVARYHLIDVRTYLRSHRSEYAHYLTVHLPLKLAYGVICLHYLCRFYKYGLSRRRLIMHNSAYLTLVHRRYRYHEASVAYRRCSIFLDISRLTSVAKYSA